MLRQLLIVSYLFLFNLFLMKRIINLGSLSISGSENFEDVILKITGNCILTGNLNLGVGCILDFEGGSIQTSNNSVIVGNSTEIRAAKYQIFYGVVLLGSFSNSTIPAEWYGATGSGDKTDDYAYDDTAAIQTALNNAGNLTPPIPVELSALTYNISAPLVLDRINQQLICKGRIQLLSNIPAIDLRKEYLKLDIREIRYRDYENRWGTTNGTGVLLSGNVHNSIISVDKMIGLKIGFDLTPSVNNGYDSQIVGLQYNKISWQFLDCETGINIKVNEFVQDSQCLWVNENQFFGGRLYSKNGIVIQGLSNNNNSINGNTFNNIGFEGGSDDSTIMVTPIKAISTRLNNFYDLRMSEAIKETAVTDSSGNIIRYEGTFIDLTDCEFMRFSIKSHLPFNYVKTSNCQHISIDAAVTDSEKGGLSKGRTNILINNKNISSVSDSSYSMQYSSTEVKSQNYFKLHYFENSTTLNFNDLFVTETSGQQIMSNICKFSVWIKDSDTSKTITIDFTNSCYKMHPEMTVVFAGDSTSVLKFINTVNGATTEIATLSKHGTYKISYDINDNVVIIPLAFHD